MLSVIDGVVAPLDHLYDCAVTDEFAVNVILLQNSLPASDAVMVTTGWLETAITFVAVPQLFGTV